MWGLCKPLDVIPLPLSQDGDIKPPLRISADQATRGENQDMKLKGKVRIQQGQRLLLADQVDYFDARGEFDATGNVVYRNPQFQLNSDRAQVNLHQHQGVYDRTHYQYLPKHASGDAARIRSPDDDHQRLEEVSYTTCDPDNVVWKLKADSIELDQTSKQGVARDMALYFKGVPIFYLPYLRFPISDQRMSGFLFPTYSTADNNSVLSLPYYWNMAPNYDMTLTPSFITNRGIWLQDEFRYLTAHSSGKLQFGYLPDDQLTGTDRGRVSYTHNSQFANHWRTNAQINYVSEASYYTDLGLDFDLSHNPYLRNSLNTTYSGKRWTFLGNIESYQILSGADQYQRMPQLSLSLKPAGDNQLNTLFSTEYNYFYSTDPASLPTVGSRLDSTVGLSYPYRNTAGFMIPSLSWNNTLYQLENRASNTLTAPSRDVPEFSLDSGLYLERSLANNRLTQTLEPRLYYLYIPYVDQSGLPKFDTSAYTFDFNQLFRDNRFSGADRIGDANQLSLALSTRFLSNSTGNELFSLSLGQIRYFSDRRVNLNAGTQTDEASNYVAQLSARLADHWNWKSTLLWDPVTDSATTSNNQLQYKADRNHIFNLEYHSTSNAGTATLAQASTSALWQLNPRWHVYGSQKYDLLEHTSLDSIIGFGYESCCWALRLSRRIYRSDSLAATPLKDLYVMEFEFKGLATSGGGTDAMLKNGILGYESKPR